MRLIIVIAAFIAAASGAAVCPCPRNLDPVCGSDGVKYDNKCLMKCQGATQVSMLNCIPPGCVCGYSYIPVCGVDGETYPNQCSMDCAGVSLAREGKCRRLKRSCACNYDYNPVCGADGNQYPNACAMECEGVALAYEGPCRVKRDACDCPPQIELPVCGKDGITYNSMCELGCAGTQFRFLGRCPATPAPTTTAAPETTEGSDGPVICTADYVPMCGDDGVTYGNLCNLEAAGNVKLNHEGECTDDNRKKREADVAGSKCECPDQIDMPVCGKDGITYNSMCAIGCAGTQFRFLGHCPATPAPTTEAPTTTEAIASTAAVTEESPINIPCLSDDCSDDN